jgi:phosphoribosylaminoimidazole-succinocarboxamide synthase
MDESRIKEALGSCFQGIERDEAKAGSLYKGKVRDVVDLGEHLLIVTSDRISAFDRVLSTIPFKGEVLNGIASWWFEKTADIIENHVASGHPLAAELAAKSPRCMLARKCAVLPVEVVVRGYLTGSAWRDYQAGRPVSGIHLPPGMRADQAFERPLITPSTKEAEGHDQPISCAEVVARGLVPEPLWRQVEEKALALFTRGQELAARNGLILVDTKYEFGTLDGRLVLVDEIHTPDSSRYWYAEGYEARFEAGEKQRELDKEWFRRWLVSQGWMGDGVPPKITDEARIETAKRYVEAYEVITGREFGGIARDMKAERDFISNLIR